jgi:hypothetical protein
MGIKSVFQRIIDHGMKGKLSRTERSNYLKDDYEDVEELEDDYDEVEDLEEDKEDRDRFEAFDGNQDNEYNLEEGEEYELVEIEFLPEKMICPDCGGITLEGLDFCDKCGGYLKSV